MDGCTLQIGAFYRTGSVYFDDVVLSGTDPPTTFTTALEELFPGNMLNDTLPAASGWPYAAGTGGSDAINRVFKLEIASVPEMSMNNGTITRQGINGDPLFIRLRKAPKDFSCSINLPQLELDDASYDRTWDELSQVAFRQVYCWLLHSHFAAKGFIDIPDVHFGYKRKPSELFTFTIKSFYRATISAGGATKTYTLQRYV